MRPLLLHPDESAGGLMTSGFLVLGRRMTAAEAIQAVRDTFVAATGLFIYFSIARLILRG